MTRPVIAFLTDFGTRDHYVGAMKGVALIVCPDATLVDITHEIDPQDVLAGALELGAAFPCFPEGTVFVAVVDPGVGSARRGIAAAAAGRHFVAPDNGLLTLPLRAPGAQVVSLTEPRYARPEISRTFEGRDRFAPAAAWLARGTGLMELGDAVRDPVLIDIPEPTLDGDVLRGEVLRVDRFGNLITNVDRAALDRFTAGSRAIVAIDSRVGLPIVGTYADVPSGTLCALVGSTDRLEIAIPNGSAADVLGASRGAAVLVARG